jgi:hypothetical protein
VVRANSNTSANAFCDAGATERIHSYSISLLIAIEAVRY